MAMGLGKLELMSESAPGQKASKSASVVSSAPEAKAQRARVLQVDPLVR